MPTRRVSLEFVLVGHSLGGVTITETAVRHPERVAALVYVGALVPGPGQSAAEVMAGGPLEAMPVLPEDLAQALFGTGLDEDAWAEHYAALVPDAPGIDERPAVRLSDEDSRHLRVHDA